MMFPPKNTCHKKAQSNKHNNIVNPLRLGISASCWNSNNDIFSTDPIIPSPLLSFSLSTSSRSLPTTARVLCNLQRASPLPVQYFPCVKIFGRTLIPQSSVSRGKLLQPPYQNSLHYNLHLHQNILEKWLLIWQHAHRIWV